MNNRKILTLEEVLNLKERPTLQMMVDLSVEDYTKYLFEKGIIKYIPESGSVEDYRDPEGYKYNSDDELPDWEPDYSPTSDLIVYLKKPDCVIKETKHFIEFDENEILNESENGFVGEVGVVNIYGKDYNYVIDDFDMSLYKIDEDGDKNVLRSGFVGYLGQ